MDVSYGKHEKLKHKKKIDALFTSGKSMTQFPVRVIYKKNKAETTVRSIHAGVSVSKRNFKNAVDRNKIKRLLREGYRKNKYLVNQDIEHSYVMMFIYIGKEKATFENVAHAITKLLQKLKNK